jgi:DNA-directed RNA polymerase specialized sigma24 family protein
MARSTHEEEAPTPEEKALFDQAVAAVADWSRGLSRAMGGGEYELLNEYYAQRMPLHAPRVAAMAEPLRGPWLRVTLRHFALDRLRDLRRDARGLHAWWSATEWPSLDEESAPRGAVDVALSSLPTLERAIIERAYGLDGDAASVRGVARALDLDRHEVQRRLIDGLLRMAVTLGESDLLTPLQFELCRLVLQGGCGVAEAAQRLGITTEEARRSLKQARGMMERVR